MSENDPGPAVSRFIMEHLGSVNELEILLLLRRNPRDWTVDEVSRELRIDRAWCARELEDFASRGLLASSGGEEPHYRFAPTSPALAEAVKELDEAYRRSMARVVSLIYSKPLEKMRAFADAFKLRRERNERDG